MSNTDGLASAREVVDGDPLAKFLGIQEEDVALNQAVLSLTPQAHHLNSGGRVHGGTIYALIDLAAAVAADSGSMRAWLVEGKVNFLAGAAPDVKLITQTKPVDKKRRLSLREVRV